MVYGLSCVPNVYQSLINDVLQDMLCKFITAFSEDITVYSPDL